MGGRKRAVGAVVTCGVLGEKAEAVGSLLTTNRRAAVKDHAHYIRAAASTEAR